MIMGHKRTFNRIKAVLAEKGKNNLWLAENMEVSNVTVSRWCTNEMQPKVETLFEIARMLKVDTRELLISGN
jgi:DNA-binding XRE family transcriptional regulator